MRTMQRVGVGLLALTLAGGITACGDDDEATTDTTASGGEGDNAAFCDALVEFNGAVNEVQLDEEASEEDIKAAGEQLAPLFAEVADNAPASVSDAAGELNDTVQPLLDGDAEAFNQETTFETYTAFLNESVSECDFETVEVTATDYAFDAPDTIPVGTVSFAFTNASDAEEHEMIVFSKADGVDLSFDEILALPDDEGESKTVFATAAFAPPGESGASLATLDAGDYAMVCFISVGGAEDGPPHFTQGMIHEFTVE